MQDQPACAGTAATTALAQQLPQLLGGFGALGAAVGTVAAVAIPLTVAMRGMASSGQDVTQVFGTLAPAAQAVAGSFQRIGELAIDFAEIVVNNLDRIIITAGVAATAFAGPLVASFVAARVATFSLAGALTTLRTALIRTGIGALVIGAGEAVYQFTRLAKVTGSMGEAFSLVGAVAAETWERLRLGAQSMRMAMKAAALGVSAAFVEAFAMIGRQYDALLNKVYSGVNAIGGLFGRDFNLQSGVGDFLGGVADGLTAQAGAALSQSGTLAGQMTESFESVQRIRDLLASMKDENLSLNGVLFGGGEGEDGSGKSMGDALREKLADRENAVGQHMQVLRNLTEAGTGQMLGAWGGYFTQLGNLMGERGKQIFAVAKSLAAGQALMDAWAAHNATLRDPTLPWWMRIPAAGQVLAAGLGAWDSINSVSMNGGGGGRSSRGGGSAASSPAQAAPAAQAPLDVRLPTFGVGDLASGPQIGLFFEALMREARDRGVRFV
ncbi:hypothetical protein [Mangrovicoccus ximenensis]|uniref:hypothetical protein n=1 Tax=Mangrovicoccus ximenensis TaxID=1911570 RepID=UPI000D37E46A|nr:hypothetical protein [Mangrovicoccus ximenensis]